MAKKGPGTILPDTAPDLVADMFEAFQDVLNNEILAQSIAERLTNPDTCPVKFLPYLAWGLGMHYWPSELTEAEKRQEIKNWYEDAKRIGTVSAVKKALNRFGQVYDLVEWFDEVPTNTPGTFCVEVTVGPDGLLSLAPQIMVDSVRRAKKMTAHLNKFRFILKSSGQHFTACATRVGVTLRLPTLVI